MNRVGIGLQASDDSQTNEGHQQEDDTGNQSDIGHDVLSQ